MPAAASDPEGGGAKDRKGLYSTLGVPVTADVGEIRKAYRRLALRWHPDKNPDNPEATAEFQKISAAYEVLSDEKRREMYDTTGCIDEEELAESGDLSHATDLFAAFFGGCCDDLDGDEQAMLDEFLRLAGGAAFRRKPRKGKRGRGAKGRAAAARQMEEAMLGEAFKAMFEMGGAAEPAEPTCPQGHALKRRKADGDYECDACNRDIAEGKRFYDCRQCDFSVCLKCHKAMEEEAAAEDAGLGMGMGMGMGIELEDVIEAFCEMNIRPERHGRTVRFRCEICGKTLPSQEAAERHVVEAHEDELQAAKEELQRGAAGFGGASAAMGGFPMGPAGLEAVFAMEAMEAMMGMEELLGGAGGPGAAPRGSRRSRKKR